MIDRVKVREEMDRLEKLPCRRVRLEENASTMGSHAIYDAVTDVFLGYCDYDNGTVNNQAIL